MSRDATRNAHGQAVGAVVSGWSARPHPPRTTLEGRFCRLEPLAPGHAVGLFEAYAQASDDRDWTYLPTERAPSLDAYRATVGERAASEDPRFLAVVVEGEPLGMLALMRIDANNGVMEIGHVHFAPRLQRTPAATDAIALILRFAFADLGYRRVEWKCDSRNAPSRRAADRLGFVYEGTFRCAAIVKERNRDTAWYAMIADDWPVAELAFHRWLAETNFDGRGRQRVGLAAIRAGGA